MFPVSERATMDKGRAWFAMALLMAGTAFAACDGGRRYRDQMAVIEVGSDGTLGFEAGVQVTLPDTVAVGRAAQIKIRTYGGGCLIRDPQRGGKTLVNVKGREAVIVPWDRFSLGPRSPTVHWNCADVLTYWTRIVPVVFHERGTATVAIRGISEDTYPSRVIEVVFRLEVV